MEDTTYDVYLGLDVGKTAHHGCALAADGTKVYDKPLPQDEASLRTVVDELKAHGRVLLIVDQPNTIGALPVAVARAADCGVAYLPGLAMRKPPTCTPDRPRPTRATRSSSPIRRARCRTPCGRWTAMLKCFPR